MDMFDSRTKEIYDHRSVELDKQTDKIFAGLFAFQWLLGIALALYLSPYTWIGDEQKSHPHVWAAIFGGGLIASLPIWVTLKQTGHHANRYIVAIAQMSFSTLLIHVTGGRIETHFHIFGSLAFIAFYRDAGPVLVATAFTALDHLLGGLFWPERLYGVLTATHWRALEHAAWVIFEDVFLLTAMQNNRAEILRSAHQQAQTEDARRSLEIMIKNRTSELEDARQTVTDQQQALVSSAKMSALGEMAGGVAHEINNPLAIIGLSCNTLKRMMKKETINIEGVVDTVNEIDNTVVRIAKIVKGLRTFSRQTKESDFAPYSMKTMIQDTLALCGERFHNNSIEVTVTEADEIPLINCNAVSLSQVLLNLLGNAADAISELPEKWVHIELILASENAIIVVTDSGKGIPKELAEKIMQPFFTTKEVGKGTGLGLSISRGIMNSHKGDLIYIENSINTRFEMKIPLTVVVDENAA